MSLIKRITPFFNPLAYPKSTSQNLTPTSFASSYTLIAQAKGVPASGQQPAASPLKLLNRDEFLRRHMPQEIPSLDDPKERVIGNFINFEAVEIFLDRSGANDYLLSKKTISQWLAKNKVVGEAEAKSIARLISNEVRPIQGPEKNPKKTIRKFLELNKNGHARINYLQRLVHLDQKRIAGVELITITNEGKALLEKQSEAIRTILYQSYQNLSTALSKITSDEIFANDDLQDAGCMLASGELDSEKACLKAIDLLKISLKGVDKEKDAKRIAGGVRSYLQEKWFQKETSTASSAAASATPVNPQQAAATMQALQSSSGAPVPQPAAAPAIPAASAPTASAPVASAASAASPAPATAKPAPALPSPLDIDPFLQKSLLEGLVFEDETKFDNAQAIDQFLARSQIGANIKVSAPLSTKKITVGHSIEANQDLQLKEALEILDQLETLSSLPNPGKDPKQIFTSVQNFVKQIVLGHRQRNYLERLSSLDQTELGSKGKIVVPDVVQKQLGEMRDWIEEVLHASYRNIVWALMAVDPEGTSSDPYLVDARLLLATGMADPKAALAKYANRTFRTKAEAEKFKKSLDQNLLLAEISDKWITLPAAPPPKTIARAETKQMGVREKTMEEVRKGLDELENLQRELEQPSKQASGATATATGKPAAASKTLPVTPTLLERDLGPTPEEEARLFSLDEFLAMARPKTITPPQKDPQPAISFKDGAAVDQFLAKSGFPISPIEVDDRNDILYYGLNKKKIGEFLAGGERDKLDEAVAKHVLKKFGETPPLEEPGENLKQVSDSMQKFLNANYLGYTEINYFERLLSLDQKQIKTDGTIVITDEAKALFQQKIEGVQKTLYENYKRMMLAVITADLERKEARRYKKKLEDFSAKWLKPVEAKKAEAVAVVTPPAGGETKPADKKVAAKPEAKSAPPPPKAADQDLLAKKLAAARPNWPTLFALTSQKNGKEIVKAECTLQKIKDDTAKAEGKFVCPVGDQRPEIPVKIPFDSNKNEWGHWEYRVNGETIIQRSPMDEGIAVYFDGKTKKGFPYESNLEMDEKISRLLFDHTPLPKGSTLHWLNISNARKSVHRTTCSPDPEPTVFFKPQTALNQQTSIEGIGKEYDCHNGGKDKPSLAAELIREAQGQNELFRLGDFEWKIEAYGKHLSKAAVKESQNIGLFKYPWQSAVLYQTEAELFARLQKEIFPQAPDLSYSISQHGDGFGKIFAAPIACSQRIFEEPAKKLQRVEGSCQLPNGENYSVLLSRNYEVSHSGNESNFNVTDWEWSLKNRSEELVAQGTYTPADVTVPQTLTFVAQGGNVEVIEHNRKKPEDFVEDLQKRFGGEEGYHPELFAIGASLVLRNGDSKGYGGQLKFQLHPLGSLGDPWGALFLNAGVMGGSLGSYNGESLALAVIHGGLGVSLREFFGWQSHFDLSLHADLASFGGIRKEVTIDPTSGLPLYGGCLKLGRFNVCVDRANVIDATLFSLGMDLFHRDHQPQIIVK